jgi:hypothetical protein
VKTKIVIHYQNENCIFAYDKIQLYMSRKVNPIARFVNSYQLNYQNNSVLIRQTLADNVVYLREKILGKPNKEDNSKTFQQTLLANYMGFDRATLISVEAYANGIAPTKYKGFNIETIIKLSSFFNVPIHFFFMKDGIKKFINSLKNPVVVADYKLEVYKSYKKRLVVAIDGAYANVFYPTGELDRLYINNVLEIKFSASKSFKIGLFYDDRKKLPYLLSERLFTPMLRVEPYKIESELPDNMININGACHFLYVYFKHDYDFQYDNRAYEERDLTLGW